jgi:hypothetical protein
MSVNLLPGFTTALLARRRELTTENICAILEVELPGRARKGDDRNQRVV